MISVDRSKSEQGKQDLWNAIRASLSFSKKGPPMQRVLRDGALRLSFAQQRFLFLEQLVPGTCVNNIPVTFRLTGPLNLTALEQSLAEIVRRHEVLRTTFPVVDGQAAQIIFPDLALALAIIDLRELPETEQKTEARRQVTQEVQQPFDLAQGPLIRVKLLRLAKEEHQIILTIHHVISDGESFRVFFKELTLLYEAFSTDKPSSLSELPIQYADFAVWQHNWLHGEILESQLNYWKQQLGGNLPVLNLPTDYLRPAVQTYRGAAHFLKISKDLTEKLKSLSLKEGATLFMTVLTAFQILLARYCGQEDIIVGIPISGRNRVEIKGLIGCFVNSLAIRTNLSADPSFQKLLGQVREVILGAYVHQDLPFEKLVKELRTERKPSHPTLFQVAFILEKAPMQALEFSGLTLTPLQVHRGGTAPLDLTLEFEETLEELSGWFEYNTDLFEATTIARMAGNFQILLESIVANPDQRLSDLPLLTAAEQHQLLVEWNNTRTDYPSNACIHQFFEVQAEQTPNAVAAVFGSEQLTYRGLNHRANQLAHYLQGLGVGLETCVGICVERSLDILVGLLGILKAGAAYLPLDPAYPQERLTFMLENAQVPVLLTQQRQVKKLPSHRAKVVCLDTDWDAINRESQENPISSVTADNLAYVMYTSGSTGRPKGVSVIHRGVVRLVKEANYANLSAEEVFLQLAPISFDASTLEIWGSLLNGALLVIFPPHTPSLEELGQVIQQYQITTLWLTASLFHLMVDERLEDLKPLRQLLAGGDVLSVPHVQKFLQKIGDCKLINGYGPTENTTFTCCYPITEPDQLGNSVPIGRPITNTQVYLLDSHLQPVPIGVPGELYIGGDGLARGYLNHPDLTEEKFIPNPFPRSKGAGDSGSKSAKEKQSSNPERLYKTGDLARYLPDGNIEFLGRLDNQVKLRGSRIELGEIESTLSRYPAVRQCAVIARIDTDSDKRLVAYIVADQQQKPTTDELRRFLKQKLPDYMVPSAFVFPDALPLTPNGKIDRRALPAPDQLKQEPASTFVPPSDDLEIQLTKIWENVLGKKPISVKDNFFDVGGHSLLAVRVLAQIEKAFGKNLPLATLFQSPTIEQLANILRQKGWSAPQQTLVIIQPGGSKPPLFFFHVLGEGLKFCRPLTRHLDPEQPIYGLAAGIMDEVSLNKIENLVAYYIKEMRIIQPEGPYLLAGIYCGGRIAYEVAQQLHAQGQKVALLALVNTLKDGKAIKIISVKERVWAHWKNLLRLGPAYLLNKRRLGKVKNRLMRIYCEFYERLGLPSPQACQSFTYRKKKEKGDIEWVFAPKEVYPDRVTLFRATENMGFIDPDLGWSELAPGGLEIHDVPGNNFNMLEEPHVQVLAEKLRDCIDRVQADNLAQIPSLCSDPFVCDNEDAEG